MADCTWVVDTGRLKEQRYCAETHMQALAEGWASRASVRAAPRSCWSNCPRDLPASLLPVRRALYCALCSRPELHDPIFKPCAQGPALPCSLKGVSNSVSPQLGSMHITSTWLSVRGLQHKSFIDGHHITMPASNSHVRSYACQAGQRRCHKHAVLPLPNLPDL